MARKRKSSSRRNKIEPSAMTITLNSNPVSPGSGTTDYIDLSQICSLVNRRFYRQGLNWAIAGIKLVTSQGYVGQVLVTKLPNTWVMANSWEKSMRAWLRMNNESLQETESVRPRFLDFKVYADAEHHQAGFVGNLLPTSFSIPPALASAPTFTAGEWESSKFVVPDTTSPTGGINNYEVISVGPSYPGGSAVTTLNAVSMIEGYAASRGLPPITDPNAPDDAFDADGVAPENFLQALFNEGTQQDEQVLQDLVTENNQAPYPFENGENPITGLPFTDTMYPGGANQGSGLEFHDVVNVTSTTIGGISRIKGGNVPCGLLRLDMTNTGTPESVVGIMIDMIPGTHRGYLAEPMTEM